MDKALRGTSITQYSRADVLRILQLQGRQVSAWERAGLIAARTLGSYTFEDLGQLRTLRDLRARRLPLRTIRAALLAMQRLSGLRNALLESSPVQRGSRLIFRHGGTLMDPVTQQLSFDFEVARGADLQMALNASARGQAVDLQEIFVRAVRLEERADTVAEAAQLYATILEQRPTHAAASINLGTIRYNQRDFAAAEALYRHATEADPEYALAFFDLGNVLDETGQMDAAITAYSRAIELVPQYADAHYNLALAYERQGERRRALRHWLIYVRLDPEGPWASHARGQARTILSSERLRIVSRRGSLVAAG